MNKNQFFGEKLRLARLLHGLTQQDLGESVFVSRQFIHQLESDVREPAQDVLAALAEVLGVKESFFETALSNEVRLEQCHFRKRKTTPTGVANRVAAYASVFEQLVGLLDEYIELQEPNLPVPMQTGQSYSILEIEKLARECRRLWGLSDGPIANLSRVLENAGVIITHFGSVSDKVDALSLNRKYPIIVRNEAKESICRMRFDLAHECGHFVLHTGIETGDAITEKEADRFASELLFPRIAFLAEFPDLKGRRLRWDLIYSLKMRWGVSARAIIYKAHQYQLITAQQFRGANVWLNKTGQSRVERHDEDVGPEEPEFLQDAFSLLDRELGVTFSAIAERLDVSEAVLSMIASVRLPQAQSGSNVIPLFRGK